MKFEILVSVFIALSLIGTLEGFGESISKNTNHNFPIVTITPEKVKYGETLTFQFSLLSYDKPDEELYVFNVVNPEGVEIDATLWSAKQDSEYQFDTSHPAFNIVKAGKFSLNFEKATMTKRTGEIVKTIFFEITTNPPPIVQSKRGVNLDQIICNEGRGLIVRYDGSPSCVKSESIPKLIERGWTKQSIDTLVGKSEMQVAKGNQIFDVEYDIKNGSVEKIVYGDYVNSIKITIKSNGNGSLTINLPRDLIDTKLDYCPPRIQNAPDDEFFVLVNKEEVDFSEMKTSEMRSLTIVFQEDSVNIEIIGTCLV